MNVRIVVPMTVKPEYLAAGFGHPDELRYGIRQRAEFPLARLERGLGVFAFGDLLGRDVDTHDLTIGAAQRVPVCHPQAFADLISALAGDLNAGHRLARFHNRPDDVFDGSRPKPARTRVPNVRYVPRPTGRIFQ